MNYFTKYRFAIWTIIILSVIILSSVGTILFLKFTEKKDSPSRKRAQIGQFFKNELNLTKEQEQAFKEYRREFFAHSKQIFDSLEKKRIAMIKELGKPQPDSQILYNLADEMGELHGRLRRETVYNLLRIRGICTPEQIKKLNTINHELIRPESPKHRKGPQGENRKTVERP